MTISEGRTLDKRCSAVDESSKKLSVLEKIGYGVGDTASNLYFQTYMMWITFFYTDVFGISAAAMGWMFLVTRIWDAVNDPIIGMITDRTETRWGKFRPYILGLAPLLALCGVATFFTPNLLGGAKLLYAYITYILLTTLYSAVNTPYSALMGVMTPNSIERTGASQYRFELAFIGQLIVSGATLPLVAYFGRGNQQIGWTWTMGVFGIIAVILFTFTFFSTKERVHPPKEQKANAKQDLTDLFRNMPWVLIAIATVFQLFYAVMRGSSTPYFFKYYVLDQELEIFSHNIKLSIDNFTSYFALWGNISGIIGAFMSKVVARTIGKKNAYVGFLILSAVVSCSFYYIEPSSVLSIFGINFIVSFSMGVVSVLQWAIYTDTADYGEWKFGRRATGLVMAASLFALNLGLAFGGTFVGWILQYHGYNANEAQTAETMNGIRMLMSFYPAIFGVIGGLVMIFYPLNNKVMVKIEEDLLERRAEEA